MRIQHNINALNSHRQLGINNTAVGKNIEKLSSGFRINRAGDDAAGLAISEKMRGQIRGLDMAQKNANDGISLIQTAEGALNESHAILQRMRELSVQSSNGTYQNEVDRENINKEVTALKSEIDRISTSTHFNKVDLLNGSQASEIKADATGLTGGKNFEITNVATFKEKFGDVSNLTFSTVSRGAADGTKSAIQIKNAAGDILAEAALPDVSKANATPVDVAFADLGFKFTATAATVSGDVKISNTNVKVTNTTGKYAAIVADDSKLADGKYTVDLKHTTAADGTAMVAQLKDKDGNILAEVDALNLSKAGTTAVEVDFSAFGVKFKVDKDVTADTATAVEFTKSTKGTTFQIGANGKADQRVTLNIGDMSSKGLKIADISLADPATSNAAIDVIDKAINTVSSTRADLGALQNRLEHTVKNLGTTSENLTAAESRIRDVDMAKEMMEMTKNNILSQAAQAMLAQANQQPQGVLQLLQ
ncbi:MAG: flagellin [Oscillospiraceae bacterium]